MVWHHTYCKDNGMSVLRGAGTEQQKYLIHIYKAIIMHKYVAL